MHYSVNYILFPFLLLCHIVYTHHACVIYGQFKGCSRTIRDQMVLPFLLQGIQNQYYPFADYFSFCFIFFKTNKASVNVYIYLGAMWN